MGRDASIYLSMRDGLTQPANSMRSALSAFGKEAEGSGKSVQQFEQTQISLREQQNKLKVQLEKSKNALSEARKEFKKSSDEANGLNLEKAIDQYDQLNLQLKDVQKQAKNASQEMDGLRGSQSKLENRAEGGILGNLAAAGMARMVGNTLTLAVNANVASAFGQEAATMFSETLSGATQGAAMGTMAFGPGLGTAVGAAAGAALGAINGSTANFNVRNDAFKGVVQGAYNEWHEFLDNTLASGSMVAAQREMDQISFNKLLGEEEAPEYLAWLTDFANYTPFLYSDLTAMSKTMAPYGYDPEEMRTTIVQVGDTGAALGMDPSEMGSLITILGRMKATGNTSLRYVNQLIEKGIPAVDYLAEALGVSKDTIYDMISKGVIPGADASKIIAEYMGEANKDAMAMQALTFSGMTSTIAGLNEQLDNAMGEGFNERRKVGMEWEIDTLSGVTREQMEEAYRLMGEYQADLENQRQRTYWETIQGAMDTEDYQKALAADNGAEMGRIIAEARATAERDYLNSKEYQDYQKSEMQLVSNLRTALAPAWENYGYKMGQEFTKGLQSVRPDVQKVMEGYITGAEVDLTMGSPYFASMEGQGFLYADPSTFSMAPNGSQQAMGLSYVPYDNFPARLHEGERVLTASEARAYGKGASPNVTIQFGDVHVHNDSDVDAIAAVIASRVAEAVRLSN